MRSRLISLSLKLRSVALSALILLSSGIFLSKLGAAEGPSLDIKNSVALVTLEGKLLFELPLKPNQDHVFLAGHCLMVQRDVTPGELYPDVKQGEVYDAYTQKKVPYSGVDPMYWGGNVSTSGKWAIVARSEEGMLYGYFFLKPDCSVYNHKFETLLHGTLADPSYQKDGSMVFASVRQNESKDKFTVIIHPDGTHEMKEEAK